MTGAQTDARPESARGNILCIANRLPVEGSGLRIWQREYGTQDILRNL